MVRFEVFYVWVVSLLHSPIHLTVLDQPLIAEEFHFIVRQDDIGGDI